MSTSKVATEQHIDQFFPGPMLTAAGNVYFRIWAPACDAIAVEIEGQARPFPLTRVSEGWFELDTGQATTGSRYRFVLPDGTKVPDPASRFQPEDVHGPSEVIDPNAYSWSDRDWKGRPWEEAILYEIHLGTFTQEGTFEAALKKLDYLVEMGITAIELMPIADFAGERNWGYDGVLLYAPDSSYGRPEDLKAFVDAAHSRGLMVFLDVVYNHFGPEGNYLPLYAPQFFTDRHTTPWGPAVNLEGPDSRPVREFIIHNALYWIQEFHFDGLRLDAVHQIVDESPTHLLDELAARIRAAFRDRRVHLIVENEENEADRLSRDNPNLAFYTAQWNDDVHHALHTAATGETKGYYADYCGDIHKLGRALAEGFSFQGEMMPYRNEPRGQPSRQLPPTAFVAFIQNHDQVGNRAMGERIGGITSPEALRVIASAYLLAPQIPMLFMGEEWNSARPFLFFSSFGPDLAGAVSDGRRNEFANFPEFKDANLLERIPDPQARTTFVASKLDWEAIATKDHGEWLTIYRQILNVRKEIIIPRLSRFQTGGHYEIVAGAGLVVHWETSAHEHLRLHANFSPTPLNGFPSVRGREFWKVGHVSVDGTLGAFSLSWSLYE